jgi:hypothetical protein
MSAYVAKDEEQRTRLADTLRRKRAEATDADMLQRLQMQRRLRNIDRKMQELHEMRDSTTHPKLKAMLDHKLAELGTAREQIA